MNLSVRKIVGILSLHVVEAGSLVEVSCLGIQCRSMFLRTTSKKNQIQFQFMRSDSTKYEMLGKK